MYKGKRYEEGEKVKEGKGVKRKEYEIKVTVVRGNGNERERAESGGRNIEDNVNMVGDNRESYGQAKLEEAVREFVKRIEIEKIKTLNKNKREKGGKMMSLF